MNKTIKLTYIAVLAALCVLANVFSIQMSGSNYLTFTYIPCFLAGMYLGIIPAAAVGLVGDVIGFLINPTGPQFNPLVCLASTLLGVIPALIYKLPKINKVWKLLISLAVCLVVCTAGINTLALWLMYGAKNGKTFFAYLGTRLPFQMIMLAVNGVILFTLQQSKVIELLMRKTSLTSGENPCGKDK